MDLSRLVGRHRGMGLPAPSLGAAGCVGLRLGPGVFSSRKLERAIYNSVAFRFLSGDTPPDHDTLANFRKAVRRIRAAIRLGPGA